MPPRGTLWEIDEHTRAKHQILRKYLDAWIPIIARQNREVGLIDGYAGPGRYTDGSKGSPLIMLDAYLERPDRDDLSARMHYIFIEKRTDRIEHLRGEVGALPKLAKVQVDLLQGEFNTVMGEIIENLGDRRPVPTFLFVDPFGYDPEIGHIGSLIGYPHCEALTYLPIPWITRFIGQQAVEGTITSALGSDRWKAARELVTQDERNALIHDVFSDALRATSEFVRSFEVQSGGARGYHLFFATNHILGLEKMKDAMWSVDPTGSYTFRDSTVLGQEVLFSKPAHTGELARALEDHFGDREFSIEEAEEFTLVHTAYKRGHVKRQTLGLLERAGRVDVRRPTGARARVGEYPKGTVLRFRPNH